MDLSGITDNLGLFVPTLIVVLVGCAVSYLLGRHDGAQQSLNADPPAPRPIHQCTTQPLGAAARRQRVDVEADEVVLLAWYAPHAGEGEDDDDDD